jgi:hypothetical protein
MYQEYLPILLISSFRFPTPTIDICKREERMSLLFPRNYAERLIVLEQRLPNVQISGQVLMSFDSQ